MQQIIIYVAISWETYLSKRSLIKLTYSWRDKLNLLQCCNWQKKLGQGDHYTTVCLLDCFYFKKHYKLIAIVLSKQQVLDADPKGMQQINFTGNLDRARNNTITFFVMKKTKKPI